jgi:hypothetical protein
VVLALLFPRNHFRLSEICLFVLEGSFPAIANLSKYPKARSAYNDMLLKPITQQEIYKAYSRAKKDSASGPDGLGLKKLKQLDPQFAMTQTSLLNG